MYFNVEIIITDPVYIVKSVNDGTDQELFFLGKVNINFRTDWLDKGFFDLHIQFVNSTHICGCCCFVKMI